MKMYIRLILIILIFSTVASCAYNDDRYPYDSGYYYDPYIYHYYPSTGVYFHIYSGDYYHYHRKTWIKVRRLPENIRIYPNDRVRIRVDSTRPYVKNKEHRKLYKPRNDYRPDTKRDNKERSYNRERFEEYRKRR